MTELHLLLSSLSLCSLSLVVSLSSSLSVPRPWNVGFGHLFCGLCIAVLFRFPFSRSVTWVAYRPNAQTPPNLLQQQQSTQETQQAQRAKTDGGSSEDVAMDGSHTAHATSTTTTRGPVASTTAEAATTAESSGVVDFASASADFTAKLWSTESGQCRATLQGHTNRLSRLAWHPSSQFLATTSFDCTWRLWDVETTTELLVQDVRLSTRFGLCRVEEIDTFVCLVECVCLPAHVTYHIVDLSPPFAMGGYGISLSFPSLFLSVCSLSLSLSLSLCLFCVCVALLFKNSLKHFCAWPVRSSPSSSFPSSFHPYDGPRPTVCFLLSCCLFLLFFLYRATRTKSIRLPFTPTAHCWLRVILAVSAVCGTSEAARLPSSSAGTWLR